MGRQSGREQALFWMEEDKEESENAHIIELILKRALQPKPPPPSATESDRGTPVYKGIP